MRKVLTMLRQSSKALLANKGRSFLTILGIIIGIGSVIALISMGNGVQASITSRVSSLGTSNLTISTGAGFGPPVPTSSSSSGSGGGLGSGGASRSGLQTSSSTLTPADLESLSDTSKHPLIKAITGNVSGSSIYKVSGEDRRLTVTGVSASYFGIHSLKAEKGVLLAAGDVSSRTKSVVLGRQFAEDVFGSTDVLGKELKVSTDTYMVIGVLETANENGFSNPNAQAFIPNTTALPLFKAEGYSLMTAQAIADNKVDDAKSDITNTLLANHKITNAKLADFSVSTSKDLLSTVTQITDLLTSLLAGIAAISLVVGGIGIMNIMLVAVTERTREIGLRKAVGAKTSDILGQFMIEAVMLTVTGGLFGVGLGFLIGKLAEKPLGFASIVTLSSVLLAVGVSSAIGIVFGIYPAAKASRLNPIDALRYE